MTLHLQHFDTKLKQDLEVHEQINNSLAEYLFPEAQFALGMIYDDAATATDLSEYKGKTLQFASRERMYFADQPVRDLVYPNASDGAAYGSLVFTPCKHFCELKNVRILVVDDSSEEKLGENGGIIPRDVAKQLIGDCYGKISKALAEELTGRSDTPFQFRLGIKPQTSNDVYRIGKGTLAPFDLELRASVVIKNEQGKLEPKTCFDLLIPTSSFKGRKEAEAHAIKPGEYNLTIGIGIKALAEYGQHSLGTQVLVNYPRGVKSDILNELSEQAKKLAKIQFDPRQLAQLYLDSCGITGNPEYSTTTETEISSDLSEDFSDEDVEKSQGQQRQELLLYQLLLADSKGHFQLLEHPKVIDGLNKFIRKQWADIATGRAIKFKSALAQPSWELGLDEICVPILPDGKEVIVTRSPLVNSNGVIVLTNKHLASAKSLRGTIHIHPETAASHLQADFDGDRLAFELASKYPTLAAEVKEYNLAKNRYPNVVKAKKIAYTGSFEEIALSARSNKIGIIANQIQLAVALQWETRLLPTEKKAAYLNEISNYYKGLIESDANPNKDFKLPPQFKERIHRLADLPQQLTPEQVERSLGSVKKILFDTVSELSNELQVAVDGPKSAARPNETVIEYCKAISKYAPVAWLADKKNPEAYLNRTMASTNYSPIDLMVRQTNDLFLQSQLSARPTVQFRPFFHEVHFTEKQESDAKIITKTYNQLIKQALALESKTAQESGLNLLATSSTTGKQIEITNLLKFAPASSPVWTASTLDIKLFTNDNKSLPHSLKAVVVSDSEGNPCYQPIGTVSEESGLKHNLEAGIRLKQANVTLMPGATAHQVRAKFKEAAQYLEEVRLHTPESEQLAMAAAIWHVNHTQTDKAKDAHNLKKASIAFNVYPEQVIHQLSSLQFTTLNVVGVHQPTNEFLVKRWNGEKVQCLIALESDRSSPNYGKRLVVVEGKKFAPLSSESPALPIGTSFKALIISPPGSAVTATTPKGNAIKIAQLKNYDFADREWNGETAQLQLNFNPNRHISKSNPVTVLIKDKVLGVLDNESVQKLKSFNQLEPGFTFNASLQRTSGTVAQVHVDPESVVYSEAWTKPLVTTNASQKSEHVSHKTIEDNSLNLSSSQKPLMNVDALAQRTESVNQISEPKDFVDDQLIRSQGTDTSRKTNNTLDNTDTSTSTQGNAKDLSAPSVVPPRLKENIPEPKQSLKAPPPETAINQWQTVNKLPIPENWLSVAIAIGKRPAYLNRVWQVVDEYIADGIPLPDQAVAAMSDDFAKWQETNTSLRAWSEAAIALTKPIEYLNEITRVTQDFNSDQKPVPLAQEVLTAMKNDLNAHEQIKRIAEIQGLKDTELLNLYQQVTNYFKLAPPQPPNENHIQDITNQINKLTQELNELGQKQEQKFGSVQKILRQPFAAWNSNYHTAAKEVEQLLKQIGEKLEVKHVLESKLQQLITKTETYNQWKNQPQSMKMIKIAEVLNSPQIQSRLVNIIDATTVAKQTAANSHQQFNPHPDSPVKRSGFGR